MVPLERSSTVTADLTLDEAIERLSGRDGMVIQDGRLVGALGPNDIEAWLQGERPRGPAAAHEAALPPRPDL
jgi:hypothetical protein